MIPADPAKYRGALAVTDWQLQANTKSGGRLGATPGLDSVPSRLMGVLRDLHVNHRKSWYAQRVPEPPRLLQHRPARHFPARGTLTSAIDSEPRNTANLR